LISCNLSKRGTLPVVGASAFLVNLILYRKLIKGTTKSEVIIKENIVSPKASGKNFCIVILYNTSSAYLSIASTSLSRPTFLEPFTKI
jgi:hypothetical protein